MNYAKRQALYREVNRRRRVAVGKPLFKLTPKRRAELERAPLEEFFSVPFLEKVFGDKYRYGASLYASVPTVLHCIKYNWPDVRTVGDVIKTPFSCQRLVELSGFGGSALTVLVDSLAAFGYELNYEPVSLPKVESKAERRAKALAKRIGI